MAPPGRIANGTRGAFMDFQFAISDFRLRSRVAGLFLLAFMTAPAVTLAQQLTKISFPYGPMGLNSMPWIVAKESNLFAKNGVDVDMIFVGVSTVMIQSMLSGSANIAGLGGPAVIKHVLGGGDIIQNAATVAYFTP